MKKGIILIVFALSGISLLSQQDAMFTHYAFNTMAVNPAYAGNRGLLSATLLHRNQWVGFNGAPVTQTFVINTPIYKDKLGLGFSVIKDKIGPINSFTANLDLSYSLSLSKSSKLTFGLKGGASNYNRNLNELFADQTGDATISGATQNAIYYNFGTGVLLTSNNYYFGVSVPKLLENSFENPTASQSSVASKEQRHYYFTAGSAFDISNTIVLKPATFFKATIGAPVELDVTALLAFNKKFELGAMFRTSDALGVLAGYVFKEKLRVGYSFDWSYGNRTFTTNTGSHEVMLRYDFIFEGNREVRSPRYF